VNARNLFRYEPIAAGVLRIITGLLFLAHGSQKFLSFPGGERAGFGWTFAGPPAYAGIIELVCGLLIAMGLFTRPAAFIASGTMAVAYFMAHQPQGPLPVQNDGVPAVLFCFAFLYIAARGAGIWSADAAMSGNGAVRRLAA
jgi:putative oxidoreductase